MDDPLSPPKISRPVASSRPFLTPPTPRPRFRGRVCFARPKFDRPREKKGSFSLFLPPHPLSLSPDCEFSTWMIDGARRSNEQERHNKAVSRLSALFPLMDAINRSCVERLGIEFDAFDEPRSKVVGRNVVFFFLKGNIVFVYLYFKDGKLKLKFLTGRREFREFWVG